MRSLAELANLTLPGQRAVCRLPKSYPETGLWEATNRIAKGFAKSSHFRHIIGL
jgi:hypothetical protein